MTDRPKLTSRDIGLTENALRAVLDRALAGSGLDYHRWVTLKLLVDDRSWGAEHDLASTLVHDLKIDEAAAMGVIDALRSLGLAEGAGEGLVATASGSELCARLSGAIARIGARVYAGLDGEELVVAHRVLAVVRERANDLLTA